MTAVISPSMFFQFVLPNGVAAGYKVFTYAANTSTKQATYTDSTMAVQMPNPIPLDGNGAASWWLDPTKGYKYVLAPANDTDPPTSGIYTDDNIWGPLNAQVLTAAFIGAITNPITPAEQGAGVTPVNYQYLPGELYRYGTNTTPGTTDMTTAAQNWALVGGNLSMSYPDTVLVSGVIAFQSNTTVTIVEGATFKTNTAGLSVFKATSKSNVFIRGGKIQQTVNSSSGHIGLIEFNGCTYCKAEGVELVGAQHYAVLLSGSSYCTVRDCYVHDSLGMTTANVDSADITAYGASSFNNIVNNTCYGGTAVEHGIMVQDPGSSLIPYKNLVSGNKVGPHNSYGILNYLIDHANTFCVIAHNEIEGITGTAQSGAAGAGIYNQGAGGTVIANNAIRNCCVSTSMATLTPAAIGLNLDATMYPVSVTGNVIADMPQYYGINVVTGAALIEDNSISFSSGAATGVVGIYLNSASNTQVINNRIQIPNTVATTQGIFSYTNGASISNLTISGNTINGCSAYGIRVDQTGSTTSTNVVVNGNNVAGGSSNSIPIGLYSVVLGTLNGNIGNATTIQALDFSTCTQVRCAGNTFTTSGTLATNFAGTCTGSYYDKSNYQNTSIKNAATGLICEQLATATPASGFNSAVGDRIEQAVPVVSSPKGWRCTVAGNPGTWVSEGNL